LSKAKDKIRQQSFVFILLLLGICLIVLPLYRPADIPVLLLFLGRFHPLILHFPIVLILLCLLFEALRLLKWFIIQDRVMLCLLTLGALTASASVIAGYFLYASGDYSGRLPEQHLWFGTATGFVAVATAGIFAAYKKTRRYYTFYVTMLVSSNILVAAASHLGGSITHGQDYLTEHLQLMLKSEDHVAKPESEMLLFEDVIQPVFEARCLSCHNSLKAKGDFLMTSYANIIIGGEGGEPGIIPGVLEKSEVYKRVVLPDDHDDKMPPAGQTPMSQKEIALLKYWITSGASTDLRVASIKKDTAIAAHLDRLLPELKRYHRKAEVEALKQEQLYGELQQVAQELGVRILKDSTNDEDFYTLTMSFPPARLTSEQFRILHPYAEVFSTLSLVSSGIDDDDLYFIGEMSSVEKLFLQKTGIDGSGIIYLKKLPKLKQLNLSFTKVDDKSILDLLKLQALEEVYLYRTNTSKEVIDAIRKNRPEMKIHMVEGPYF
jgi:hypothetical protein